MNLTLLSKLPLAHFSLQYGYAKRAAQILNIPIQQALLEFTQFWVRIHDPVALKANNMAWNFDATTLPWQELCERIHVKEPADKVAYELYLKNNDNSESDKKYFGCFRYDFIKLTGVENGPVKIHFQNRDATGYGPLKKERQRARVEELKLMFKWIRKNHPEAEIVQGGSWLYNLDSYCRLFPKTFTTGMKVEEIPFPRSSGIWGQFLRSDLQVNERKRSDFLSKVDNATTAHHLLQCFEFKILFPSAAIENFYDHFEV